MAKKNQKNILLGAGVVVVIIVFLILVIPGKETAESIKKTVSEDVPDSLLGYEKKDEVQESDNEGVVLSESKMCENYVMEQGEILKIDGHTLELIKIGTGSARIIVNGENAIISEGDSVYEKKLRVELKDNDLLYFGEDDEENRVEFLVGCKSDEDPTDKHIFENVMSRGESVCKALIKSCEEEFNLE